MTKDIVKLTYAEYDTSVSAGVAKLTKTTISVANGATISDFFKSKDNSAYLIVDLTAAGDITLEAGNAYPITNIMGGLSITLGTGLNVVEVENYGRFENKDGSLNLTFGAGVAGTITAVAKRAGLK